jgi:lipopolysaccharide O-acetyltransferase
MINICKRVRSYGLTGLLRLATWLIVTKLCYRPARLIRLPIYLRGRAGIRWGAGFTTGVGTRIEALGELDHVQVRIGENVQINDYVHIAAIEQVTIGNHVLIASKVFISDHNHGVYGGAMVQSAPTIPPALRELVSRPVLIEDNVWLGEHVCVLPGVHIGRGTVVAAGAVVTQDLPAQVIAAGVPARVIKRYDPATSLWVNA